MSEIVINSPKYGNFKVYYDDNLHELISKYKWVPKISKGVCKYAKYITYGDKGKVNGCVFMHNLIMGAKGVDHIDNDGLNNYRSNLRLATQLQNNRNIRKQKNNKSGFKGVYWNKYRCKYECSISVNYKRIELGFFNNPVKAALKYNEAAIKYFGEFANVNVINNEEIEKWSNKVGKISKPRVNSKQKYRGVRELKSSGKRNGKYVANIQVLGRPKTIGHFNTPEDAAIAYNKYSLEVLGDDAKLNYIK